MNKKGITNTELAVIIIACVVLILFIILTVGMSKSLKGQTTEELCRNSMILNSKLKDKTAAVLETGIECPAPHYDIKVNTEEEASRDIIEQLRSCWYKTLGRESGMSDAFAIWNVKNYCMVCSSFDLEKTRGMDKALETSKIVKELNEIDPKTKRTYLDYLDTDWHSNDNSHFFVKASKDGSDVKLEKLEELKLSDKERENYLVVFLSYSDMGFFNSLDLESTEWDLDYVESGVAIHDVTSHTFVIPEDNIYNLQCEYLFWEPEDE